MRLYPIIPIYAGRRAQLRSRIWEISALARQYQLNPMDFVINPGVMQFHTPLIIEAILEEELTRRLISPDADYVGEELNKFLDGGKYLSDQTIFREPLFHSWREIICFSPDELFHWDIMERDALLELVNVLKSLGLKLRANEATDCGTCVGCGVSVRYHDIRHMTRTCLFCTLKLLNAKMSEHRLAILVDEAIEVDFFQTKRFPY